TPSWTGTTVDAAGDVYLATYVQVSGGDAMFATKLDGDSGEYVWSWSEDTPGDEYLTDVVVDSNSTVLLLGYSEE
ncbi:unnamed protein product, partial [Ectocarpus fasciculatus]